MSIRSRSGYAFDVTGMRSAHQWISASHSAQSRKLAENKSPGETLQDLHYLWVAQNRHASRPLQSVCMRRRLVPGRTG